MKREILYKKPPKNAPTAEQIKAWLTAHPYFKWSSMCKEVGLHPGNFHAHVLRATEPRIKTEILPKIAAILADYGFKY